MPIYLQKARWHNVAKYRTGDDQYKNYELRPAEELFKYGERQLESIDRHNLGNQSAGNIQNSVSQEALLQQNSQVQGIFFPFIV